MMSEMMIAWLNGGVLLLSALLFTGLYVISVSPAQLERRLGARAYRLCGFVRGVAMLFEFLALANYVVYFFYPLPLPLPAVFPWGWPVSIGLAVLIGVPSLWLMVKGMVDAGMETAVPDKAHTLYSGIYKKMRHPQATGEVMLWWVAAFALNSPHLALISVIWLPLFYLMCLAEERDLALRYGEDYADYRAQVGFLFPKRS